MSTSLVLLIVILTAFALHDANPPRVPARTGSLPRNAAEGALAKARERLRRGEIDHEDYLRIAQVLRG